MKRVIILLVILGFLAGCVSTKKYDDLNRQLTDARQKSETAGSEVKLLKQQNDALAQELQRTKQVPEYYYKAGMDFYNRNRLDRALESFEKVVDRYPTDAAAAPAQTKITEILNLSSSNAEKILKAVDGARDPRTKLEILDKEMSERYLTKEDTERLQQKRDYAYGEVKFLEEANKHTLVEDDPTQSVRTYRTTRSMVQRVNHDKSFSAEIYAVQHYSGKRDLRLRTRYTGNKWISYDTVSLRGENGLHVDVVCKYPEKLSSMAEDRVSEWSDNDVDDDKVIKLSKSSVISVRFSGGYKYTYDLTDEQIQAIREIVRKYQTLK